MDHKNLTYFKEPRKLSWRQAWWLLFLQDFDLAYWALPGTQMAPANTLSHQDDMDTSLDNMNVQPLLSNAFNQQIWAINMALVDEIKHLSSSNPLVLQAVHQMKKELLLFNRSQAKDWTFDDRQLYFKHCLYILEVACHDLVNVTHCSFERGHKATCEQLHSSPRIIGGQASSSISGGLFLDAWSARHTRCLPIQPFPPSLPLSSRDLVPFRTSLWISLWTFPWSIASILSWSWLTMALVRG